MYRITWDIEIWENVPCNDGTLRTFYLPLEVTINEGAGIVDSFGIAPLTEDYEEACAVVRQARQDWARAA